MRESRRVPVRSLFNLYKVGRSGISAKFHTDVNLTHNQSLINMTTITPTFYHDGLREFFRVCAEDTSQSADEKRNWDRVLESVQNKIIDSYANKINTWMWMKDKVNSDFGPDSITEVFGTGSGHSMTATVSPVEESRMSKTNIRVERRLPSKSG